MMPAAKHFDPVLGIDVHIIQPPGPVPPVPIPHPFIGFLIDEFDYVPILGSTVMINGMHRGQAGTAGKCVPPHIPIGGTFIKPPANECEMFMGSSTVTIDGDAQSYLALPALSCQCIGMPPIPRMNPKKKSKIKSLVLPTSVVLPIPAGPPVLIGGPPTISLMALGMRVGLAALGKGLKKLAKTKMFKKVKTKIKSKLKKRKPSANKGCGRPGEPIDVVTGANVDDFVDYQLPGTISLLWRRFYDSSLADADSPMGRGFRHEYQRELRQTRTGFEFVNQEGEVVEFPRHEDGQEMVFNDGLRLIRMGGSSYQLVEYGQPTMQFHLHTPDQWAPLQCLYHRGQRVEFKYDDQGQLTTIHSDDARMLRFQQNASGQITQVDHSQLEGSSETIARYEYDQHGRLVAWYDAFENVSRYEYDAGHRMTKKSDRNQYSYHYVYDSSGRCIHSYGDDGMYDVKLTYLEDTNCTVATYSDGAAATYFFDDDGNLTELVDACGGSTAFNVDQEGRIVEEIEPNGDVTRYLYDRWGAHTGRVDAAGQHLAPMHLQPHAPDPLAYQLPDTAMEWEFGTLWNCSTVGQPTSHDPVLTSFPEALPNFVTEGPVGNAGLHRRFDTMQQLIEEVDEDGKQTWQYDRNGNIISHRDRTGAGWATEIESWNLTGKATDPLGGTTEFEYSLREEITKIVDPNGTMTEFGYDHCDRLTEVRRHGVLREKYVYDVAGQLVEKQDGLGNSLLSLVPGPLDLWQTCELAGGDVEQFEYDERGRIIQAKNAAALITLDYSPSGIVQEDRRDGQGVEHMPLESARQTTVLDRFQVTVRSTGRDTFVVQDPTGKEHGFRYSDNGLLSRELANGSREIMHFDRHGRCVRKQAVSGSSTSQVWDRQYSYTPEGDLQLIRDSVRGETSFDYDAAQRLVGELHPNGQRDEFQYDRGGNLLRQPGLHDVELTEGNRLKRAAGSEFQYNERNHVAVKRDEAGGETRYRYDASDMLTHIESARPESARPESARPESARPESACHDWEAAYDALGRRVRKRWGEHSVEFYWDDDRLMAEVRDGQRLRIYIYAHPSSLVPFMFVDYERLDQDPREGKCFYLFTNQIGVPLLAENDSGEKVWEAEISPYGQVALAPNARINVPLRFPGHYHDEETGLFYNRFRYYDPELGRYLQSDPLGLAGGLNLYAYPSSPLNTVDLQGLAHSSGKSKTKGRRKGKQATEVPSGPKPKVDGVDEFAHSGMTRGAFDAVRETAKKHGVRIRMRSSNPACLKWIKKRYPKKPAHVKNKSINDVDILMGPPPRPRDEGLVGHFKPKSEEECLARARKNKGEPLSADEIAKVKSRRAQRLDEYNAQQRNLQSGKASDHVEVDKQRGVIKDKKSGKPITGDHDIFDIQKQQPDGSWKAADKQTKNEVVRDLRNDPNVEAQHGDHKSWDVPPDKTNQDINNAILDKHSDPKAKNPTTDNKGDPLVDFYPDGETGTSYY